VDKRGVQETRMKIKLNGWQRIGIVLNAIYLIIIIIIAWNVWPTQKKIESSWVYSSLNAIVKPGTYAYELRESRFKDISDRELIKRINLYLSELVQQQQLQKEQQTGQSKIVEDSERFLLNIERARKEGYSDNEIAEYLTKQLSVTDSFIIAQLLGELVTPSEKLAQQCEEILKEVNLRYQKEIESLGKNRLRVVGISFTAWIIPSGTVYLLCLAIVWIYRGFKENKNLVN